MKTAEDLIREMHNEEHKQEHDRLIDLLARDCNCIECRQARWERERRFFRSCVRHADWQTRKHG